MSAPEVGALCSYFIEEEQAGLQDTVPHKEGKVVSQIPLGLRLYSLAGPEDISGQGPSIHGGSHGLLGSSKQHMKLEISSLSNLKKYY